MTDTEQTLLNHYHLSTLYPSEWPAERDDSEASEDEMSSPKLPKASALHLTKSRYSALERAPSSRSSLPGSQRTADGAENIVQRDEPDPLGSTASVVRVLRQQGLPVDTDTRLRNRFLLSSNTFSPSSFLSQVHNTASTESLLQGLDFLSRSIEEKSASLKVLVESNFERFVRAKATIDNVYNEMRNQDAESEQDKSDRRTHTRQTSKPKIHFRKTSGPFGPGTRTEKPLTNERKKNALVKESEYGVQGIKTPLIELAVKAEEIWGPALGGHERERELKVVSNVLRRNRGVFEVGEKLEESIRRRDYDAVVEDYSRAYGYAKDAKSTAGNAVQEAVPLTDAQIHQIIVTARVWANIRDQIEAFKRDCWRRLANAPSGRMRNKEHDKADDHLHLLKVLLELGTEDNPIWVWLVSRYEYLKTKIASSSERSRIELEFLRRRLANSEKPKPRVYAAYFRGIAVDGKQAEDFWQENAAVNNYWESVQSFLTSILSKQGGFVGDVAEFWDTAQSFINGSAQKSLPIGIDGRSRHHHWLSNDAVRQLQNGTADLIKLIRETVSALFTEPPVEDILMLYSPVVPTPDTPTSALISPSKEPHPQIDQSSVPPPSPRTGEAWEKYAFWAPYAHALSGSQYLSKIASLVGNAANDLLSANPADRDHAVEQLRLLVGVVRERSVQAVCAAWNQDAENFKFVEDWTHNAEQRDLTNMPSRFSAFENFLVTHVQKILYIPDVTGGYNESESVVPPSSKLLQMVRSQFVTSIYKTLTGIMENAEKHFDPEDGNFDIDVQRVLGTGSINTAAESPSRNIRVLLTLSNLQALRNEVIPELISQFEANFSMKLTEETRSIRDSLAQIEARLFQSYVKPTVERLTSTIQAGVTSRDWLPQTSRPADARPYVYDVLLSLVLVHNEVSTTASPLTGQILSYLLEQISTAFMEAFKRRPGYTLNALMQATLDVEFMAQTVNSYTTEKASETQSQVYLVLDERTDNDARTKLQKELPEMKAILKRLREGTKGEFACFKRQRSQRDKADRPGSREGRPLGRD